MPAKHPAYETPAAVAELFSLDLKNRGLAALLAWLVPGLGHLYQGRRAKAALYAVSILSTFLFGAYIGKGHVVYASTAPVGIPRSFYELKQLAGNHWKFVCQAGIGSAAIPALVQRSRVIAGREPLLGGLFAPPAVGGTFLSKDGAGNTVRHPSQVAQWNYDLGFYFELGGVYTLIAGLLNLLVVFDAANGPLMPTRDPHEPHEPHDGGPVTPGGVGPPNGSDAATR